MFLPVAVRTEDIAFPDLRVEFIRRTASGDELADRASLFLGIPMREIETNAFALTAMRTPVCGFVEMDPSTLE